MRPPAAVWVCVPVESVHLPVAPSCLMVLHGSVLVAAVTAVAPMLGAAASSGLEGVSSDDQDGALREALLIEVGKTSLVHGRPAPDVMAGLRTSDNDHDRLLAVE